MAYASTGEGNSGWGSLLGGGVVGYFLGAATGGNWFGGPNRGYMPYGTGAMIGAYDTSKLDAIIDHQANFQRQADTSSIIDNVTAGTQAITASLNTINRDNYILNALGIYNDQTAFRNVDQQFCNTNAIIQADGVATRNAVDAFKDQWQEARYQDLLQRLNNAENRLANVPMQLALSNLTNQVADLQRNFIPGAVRSVPACPTNNSLCPCSNS